MYVHVLTHILRDLQIFISEFVLLNKDYLQQDSALFALENILNINTK